MKLTGLFLLISIYSLSSFASKLRTLPEYCKDIPVFSKGVYKEYFKTPSMQDNSRAIYTDSRGNKDIHITVSDLKRYYDLIDKTHNKYNIERLGKRMTAKAISNILKEKDYLLSIFPNLEDDKSIGELISCGAKRAYLRPEVSLEIKEWKRQRYIKKMSTTQRMQTKKLHSFYFNQFVNAMLVEYNLKKKDVIGDIFSKEVKSHLDSRNNGRTTSIKMVRYQKKLKSIKKEQEGFLKEELSELYYLVKTNPLLFKIEQKVKLSTDYIESKFVRSDFQKEIIAMIHSDIRNEFFHFLNSNPTHKQFARFMLERADSYSTESLSSLTDGMVRTKMLTTISKHNQELNKIAKNVCQNNGVGLQQFEQLTSMVLKDTKMDKKQTLSDLGAICTMIQDDIDKGEESFTLKQGLGVGLSIAGLAIQFTQIHNPFGWLGWGIGGVGASLLLDHSYESYMKTIRELEAKEVGFISGWSEYQEMLDAYTAKTEGTASLGVEVGAMLLGVKGGHTLVKKWGGVAKKTRFFKLNNSRVQRGEIDKYKASFWRTHKKSNTALIANPDENLKMSKFTDALEGFNRNNAHYAHYNHTRKRLDGTTSYFAETFDVIKDGNKSSADDWSAMLKNLELRTNRLNDYRHQANKTINAGFEVRDRLNNPELISLLKNKAKFNQGIKDSKDGFIELRLKTFKGGISGLNEHVFTDVGHEIIRFRKHSDVRDYISHLKSENKAIFSSNAFEESNRGSRVFHQTTEQAYEFKELKMLRDRLDLFPDQLGGAELKVLKMVNKALLDPNNFPRSGARKYLRTRELVSAGMNIPKSLLKIVKKKKEIGYSHFNFSQVEGLKNSNITSWIKKNKVLLIGAASTMTAGGIMYDRIMEYTGLAEVIAWYHISSDEKSRDRMPDNATAAEVQCAAEGAGREWSFETSCYPLLALKFIRPYIYKSIRTKSYSLANDVEVQARLDYFRKLMIDLQHTRKERIGRQVVDEHSERAKVQEAKDRANKLLNELFIESPEVIAKVKGIINERDISQKFLKIAAFVNEYEGTAYEGASLFLKYYFENNSDDNHDMEREILFSLDEEIRDDFAQALLRANIMKAEDSFDELFE